MKTFKTLQELRDFYESVPEDRWCTGELINDKGQACANGLLGIKTYTNKDYNYPYPEGLPLDYRNFATELQEVNDATFFPYERYKQETPKERVLAYLDDLITAKLKADGKLTTI